MRWLVPVVLGVGVAAVIWPSAPSRPGKHTNLGGWVDADAPRRIRELADRLNWPGLADFLVAVAFWESRGNSRAGDDDGNAARGWFGMRPVSARVSDLGLDGSILKDEPSAVAFAAWYAWRLRPWASPGQVLDWLAIRRGWRLPSLVDDESEKDQQSANVRNGFSAALAAAGVNERLMRDPAIGSFEWPGIHNALRMIRDA